MADIVKELIDNGHSLEEIMHRLQMEDEEVLRLANRLGIPQSTIKREKDFGKGWKPID